ncbi:TasA family protein [Haloarcula amylovorans]|uniref:TasA family protein n=1 Tax=Haloarcula amylovorans TaxID=2562280 RepID=UPI0010760BD1|nr:TasA family protein [Halomicroarcula amylolytica]
MSDKNVKLSRRRVLGGLVTLGGAAAAAGAGTFALFSDTEEADTTINSGTLNLQAGSEDNGEATATVDVSDAFPGDSGAGSTTLTNDGNIDGYLDFTFSSAVNAEGDDPESEPDTNTNGDLGSVLQVTVEIDDTTLRTGTFNEVFDGTESDDNIALNATTSKTLNVDWSIPSDAGNEIQGDLVNGDITIELGQQMSQ